MAHRNGDRETYELEHTLDNQEATLEYLERIALALERIALPLPPTVSHIALALESIASTLTHKRVS